MLRTYFIVVFILDLDFRLTENIKTYNTLNYNMTLTSFKNIMKELEEALLNIAYNNADMKQKPTITLDLKARKIDTYKTIALGNMNVIKKKAWELTSLAQIESNKEKILILFNQVRDLERLYDISDIKGMIIQIQKINEVLNSLKDVQNQEQISFDIPNLHSDIKDQIIADLKELNKCYNSGCYRSAVIICGRILETALHRKYYEITGNDALEKSPGIGLGTLVAKLMEKNIKFDPGLTQQIHLINQVRISSVHTKQEPFYPTQMQAHAIILYTLDSVRKMF